MKFGFDIAFFLTKAKIVARAKKDKMKGHWGRHIENFWELNC